MNLAFLTGSRAKLKSALPQIAKQTVSFFLGLFAARISIFGGRYPFGIGFTAAAPTPFLALRLLGTAVGYLSLGEVDLFRYLAGLMAVGLIRILTVRLCDERTAPWMAAGSASLLVTLTGFVAVGSNTLAFFTVIGEGLMAGASAYLFYRVEETVTGGRPDRNGMALIGAVATVGLVGLFPLSWYGFSLGAAVSGFLIGLAAACGGVTVSTIAGCLCGLAGFLAGQSNALPVLLTMGGVLGGIGQRRGRLLGLMFSAVAISAVGALLSFPLGTAELLAVYCVGYGGSFLVPRRLILRLSALFLQGTPAHADAFCRERLANRLDTVAATLQELQTAEDSRIRQQKESPLCFADAVGGLRETVCIGCTFFEVCWNREQPSTVAALSELGECLIRGRTVSEPIKAAGYFRRCPRKERVETDLISRYDEFAHAKEKERCQAAVLSALSRRSTAWLSLLTSLSHEMTATPSCEPAFLEAVAEGFRSQEMFPLAVSCYYDERGRLEIKALLEKEPRRPIGRARLCRTLTALSGKRLCSPRFERGTTGMTVTLTELPNYELEVGSCALSALPNEPCGDSFDSWQNDRDLSYLAISDGMGTGKSAAAESHAVLSLCRRMTDAAFPERALLPLLDQALSNRSAEETAATLDLVQFDEHNGDLVIWKLGAAPSIVRHRGKTAKATCNTLPLGILSQSVADRFTASLEEDDRILLVSDGVAESGTEWLIEEVKNWQNESPSHFSEHIALEARRRHKEGKPDDITVIAAVVQHRVTP